MWIKACSSDKLKENTNISIQVCNKRILIVKSNNQLFAIEDKCPHQEQSLEGGDVIDGRLIVCPWHSVTINLKSGKIVNDMGFIGLPEVQTFEVKEENGEIFINMPHTC